MVLLVGFRCTDMYTGAECTDKIKHDKQSGKPSGVYIQKLIKTIIIVIIPLVDQRP